MITSRAGCPGVKVLTMNRTGHGHNSLTICPIITNISIYLEALFGNGPTKAFGACPIRGTTNIKNVYLKTQWTEFDQFRSSCSGDKYQPKPKKEKLSYCMVQVAVVDHIFAHTSSYPSSNTLEKSRGIS